MLFTPPLVEPEQPPITIQVARTTPAKDFRILYLSDNQEDNNE